MNSSYLAIVFIAIVCMMLYLILKVVLRLWNNMINTIKRSIHQHTKRTISEPSRSQSSYTIDQNEFARIAYKNGYRNPRTESVVVNGNYVHISFSSQSGQSQFSATIIFETSGSKFGQYVIHSTNPDSGIPKRIAEKIRVDMTTNINH